MENLILIKELDPLIYRDPKRKRVIKIGLYKCHCGKEFPSRIEGVKGGYTKSCGCLKYKGNNTTHGMSKTSISYDCWCSMKSRCYNKNDKYYHHYGGRGIIVCEKWRNSFENFLKDIGERPSRKHSIDRINVNGNYEPENCRWATPIEQANNTRSNHFITYKGETKTIANWARSIGLSHEVLRKRLKRWSIEDALNKPLVQPSEKYKFKNKYI